MITIWRAMQKRSHVPNYKTYTKKINRVEERQLFYFERLKSGHMYNDILQGKVSFLLEPSTN